MLPKLFKHSYTSSLKVSFLFLNIFLGLLCSKIIKAQDIHFSQFFDNQIIINPANTGFFNGKIRVSSQLRDQWRKVNAPYFTFNLAIDKNRIKNSAFSIGFYTFFDRAGQINLSTNHIALSIAYKLYSEKYRTSISFGTQPYIENKFFDFSKATFDNQYGQFGFNKNLNPKENFNTQDILNFNVNGGISSQTYIGERMLNFSISINNILQNSEDYNRFLSKVSKNRILITSKIELPIKNSDFMISPIMLYNHQINFDEFILGGLVYYTKENKGYSLLNAGITYRNKDALTLITGGNFKNIKIGFSYDFNLSKLSKVQNYNGAWEIYIRYINLGNINPARKLKRLITCPSFI